MNPTVVNVSERNVLAPNGNVSKAIVLTYKVGAQGPFTLITTQDEIANGGALQKMQAFANNLAQLPLQTS